MRLLSHLFLTASLVYALVVFGIISASQQNQAKAATNHVVISQIQVGATADADDEFVELYNPTDSPINLAKWRLVRETSLGTFANLAGSLSGTIEPRGYYLITSQVATASTSADKIYSTSTRIAGNNTILLENDALELIDKVGLGNASDPETTSIASPAANGSVLRKASATSTAQTLSTGGSEANFGNGYDTDNNSTDFVLLTTSMPRNSTSPQTQPTPTNTPNPTDIPIPTLTPTPTPTSTPILTETPTPTTTATPIPTEVITPTITPNPTITPTPASETIVDEHITSRLTLVCIQTNRVFTVLGHPLVLPSIRCDILRTTP